MASSASLPFALQCNSFQSSPSHFQAQSCFSTASPLARRTSQISSSSLNNSAVPHLPCGLQCLSKSDAPIQSTSRVPDSRFYVGSGDGPHHMQREENELENDSPFPRNLNGRALSSDSFPSQDTVVPATSTAFPSQNAVVPATSAGLTGGTNRYLLDFLKGTTLRKGVALSSKTGWDRSRINRKNSGTISDSGEGHGSSNAVDDLRGSSGLLAKRSHLKGVKPKVANTAYEEMQNATEQEDKRRLKGISEKVPSERLWMDRYAEPAKSRTFSLSDGQQLRLQNQFPGFKGSKERKPIQLPSLSGVSGNQPFSKSLSFASVEGKTRISQVKERRLTRKQDTLAGVGSSSSSQEFFSFPDKDSSSKEQAHARYTTENNRQGKRMPFTTSVPVGEKWNESMISTFHAKVQSGKDSGKSRGEDFYVIDTHETTTDGSMTESKILSREFRDRGREASSSTVKGSLDVKGKDLGSGASTPVVRQDDKQILSAFSQDFALPENLSSLFSKPSNPLPHSSKSNQQLIPGTQRHMPNGTGQDVTFSTSAKRLFKSIGSRSSPSKSSIPGRFSKYSYESDRKISKGGETPSYFGAGAALKRNSVQLLPQSSLPASASLQTESADSASRSTLSGKDLSQPDGMGSFSSSHKSSPSTEKDDRTKITEHSPLKVHPLSDLPFEYQYSYSETPNVAPIGYREPQFSPFGPVTMGRPWTGRAPLKPSKKKLPEFDSFNPPPRGKKGVKYVQNPGPFSEGQIPREASSREEILGEPLSKEEVEELVKICSREKRQLNLGRDGLIHNMLDLIHSHWKRRRVCRIKCKGVPTVDMDNVCMHLEEKTWGKIIHRAGGVVYLFRGRNYNYKNRPRIPLMLWKPAAPIYPKLIQPAPAGLTKEEADELRRIGRKVVPICKLGKNGVYLNLVKDVQEAFKADELVRVNCQGLNPSDFKKIGAKLKELVPCVLLSFEREHILMWKGRGANSVHVVDELLGRAVDDVNVRQWNMEELEVPMDSSSCDDSRAIILETIEGSGPVPMGKLCSDDESTPSDLVISSESSPVVSSPLDCSTESSIARSTGSSDGISMGSQAFVSYKPISEGTVSSSEHVGACGEVSSDHKGGSKMFEEANMPLEANLHLNNDSLKWGVESEIELSSESKFELNDVVMPGMKSEEAALQTQDLEEVDVLWEQAIESGVAMALDETESDSDFIYEKASKFAHAAPDGPSYTRSLLKTLSVEENKTEDSPSETNGERQQDTKSKKRVTQTVNTPMLEVPPMGGLPIDELARLLAP